MGYIACNNLVDSGEDTYWSELGGALLILLEAEEGCIGKVHGAWYIILVDANEELRDSFVDFWCSCV